MFKLDWHILKTAENTDLAEHVYGQTEQKYKHTQANKLRIWDRERERERKKVLLEIFELCLLKSYSVMG